MASLTRHLIPIVLATAFGTIAYVVGLRMIWNQDITGELPAVVFVAATSLCIAYPLVYLPSFRLLTRRLHGSRPNILFPLLGVVLGVAPVLLINLRWAGNLNSMLSPESQLFYILFAGVGVVLGGAYPLVDRRYCDQQRIDGHAT
jgi:hypothetical protein